MARIPEEELERLKREVDLVALVRSKGIELKPHGSKDLAGFSPFSKEKTPSFIVTPQKNLWHCMSSGQGGSVIDFLMKHDGVSFRHAAELLRDGNVARLVSSNGHTRKATVPKLESPVAYDADDRSLFEQVLEYYRERLTANPAAVEYLAQRGLSAEAVETFGIGFADRTLGLRLPQKNRKSGAAIRERLTKLGLYRESGHEHFSGCVVFPIRDEQGHVSEIYGRKIVQRQSTGIYHLYLPGPHRGIFNAGCLESPEVILTESVIDALTFWCAGLRHVTCIWGTEGFTEEHLEAFKKHKSQRVYLAYDNDKAGNRAAERDASRLMSIGVECFRVNFPAGMDANEYARKVTPAEKSLTMLLKSSQWLGKGSSVRNQSADTVSSNNLLAAKVSRSGASNAAEETESVRTPESEEDATKDKKSVGVAVEERDEAVFITIHGRRYRVRGLEKNNSFEVLKVNLRVLYRERFHLDTIDLYRAKDRQRFAQTAAEETGLEVEPIKRDLGKVLLKLEDLQEGRLRAALEPAGPAETRMSEEEKAEALELLRSPDLLEKILADFDKCGVVGEATNKLTGYLAAVSRKLDRPLAVIVQSTSAAGKTALMESVLAFMPEEERIKYSAMTGQSLYYLGETNLKHKILAIVEEEGAEKASYALKLLQSEGELTIASTGKDPNTGRMQTEEYHVEGPVMIFLTTTAVDIDEELLNRCLVLSVDEGREQTEAIHRIQREAETFEGLKRKVERDRVLKVHRNAQRLLEPLAVVNPYAPRLTFLSNRTRSRRDHVKYLALIRSIVLLHQHQREIQETDPGTPGQAERLRYIEATLEDIEAANRLAHEVLGRSLDELSPQTRRLLLLLKEMVRGRCEKEGLDPEQCLFSRREVRRFTGWTEFQVRTHLNKLEEMEYLLAHRGGRGWNFVYELLFDGEDDDRPQMCGLIDTTTLRTSSIEKGTSSTAKPTSSPQRASNEPGSRFIPLDAKAVNEAGCGPNEPEKSENGENAHRERKKSVVVS